MIRRSNGLRSALATPSLLKECRLTLALVYLAYFVGLGHLRPDTVPPIPMAERDALPALELWRRIGRSVAPTLLLLFAVLGSIIGGVAAPTEAASTGAAGILLNTAVQLGAVLPEAGSTTRG